MTGTTLTRDSHARPQRSMSAGRSCSPAPDGRRRSGRRRAHAAGAADGHHDHRVRPRHLGVSRQHDGDLVAGGRAEGRFDRQRGSASFAAGVATGDGDVPVTGEHDARDRLRLGAGGRPEHGPHGVRRPTMSWAWRRRRWRSRRRRLDARSRQHARPPPTSGGSSSSSPAATGSRSAASRRRPARRRHAADDPARPRRSPEGADSLDRGPVRRDRSAAPSGITFRGAASGNRRCPGDNTLTIPLPPGTVAGDFMIASVGVPAANAVDHARRRAGRLIRRIEQRGRHRRTRSPSTQASRRPASPRTTPGRSTVDWIGRRHSVVRRRRPDRTPSTSRTARRTASSLNHTAPSITTTTANDMIVTSHAFSSGATWTPPAGMTQAFDVSSTRCRTSSACRSSAATRVQAAVGATGTKTAAASNDADTGNTHTIALNAAPAGHRLFRLRHDRRHAEPLRLDVEPGPASPRRTPAPAWRTRC